MVRIPTHQAPPHPGEILLEDFLKPMEIAPGSLADAIGLSLADIDEILSGSRGISPSTALRLAKFFGTTHDFWINLQSCWDVYHVQTQEATEIVIPFCLLAATVSIPPTPRVKGGLQSLAPLSLVGLGGYRDIYYKPKLICSIYK